MRSTFFLLAAAVILAACSEETTAPLANKSALAPDNTPTGQSVGVQQAKARLTITEVATPFSTFAGAGNAANNLISGWLTATCPTGMSAIAGGHEVIGNAGDIIVYHSRLYHSDSWQIAVINMGSPFSEAQVKATVMCVQ